MNLAKSITSLGCGVACMAGSYGMFLVAIITRQDKLLIPAVGMAGGGVFMTSEAIIALFPEKKDD